MSAYFNSQRDNETISSGGFFCDGCLVGRPADDRSADDRYCQGCYGFLLAQADELPARPCWAPRAEGRKQQVAGGTQSNTEATQVVDSGCNTQQVVVGQGAANVTPLMQAVFDLAEHGMSSRKIASALAENGAKISHMTVARWLMARNTPKRVIAGES